MINRIIECSGNNKLLVFILIGFAVAAGILSIRVITLDAIQDPKRHAGDQGFAVGIAARTSWRIKSRTRSSPPCWGRRK